MFENFNVRKMSLKEAKSILNRNRNAYTDEEVEKIVAYFYALAELQAEHRQRKKSKG